MDLAKVRGANKFFVMRHDFGGVDQSDCYLQYSIESNELVQQVASIAVSSNQQVLHQHHNTKNNNTKVSLELSFDGDNTSNLYLKTMFVALYVSIEDVHAERIRKIDCTDL